MAGYCGERLYLVGIQERHLAAGASKLTFQTNRGRFAAVSRIARGTDRGVVMLGDGKAELAGPGGVYADMAGVLADRGISSLRMAYRDAGDCVQCGLDTLLALQYLYDEGVERALAIGWGFGAAVAVAAGSVGRTVEAIAAISILNPSGCCNRFLRAKPILIVHGESDTVAPIDASRRLYADAGPHRRMLIYPGAGHNLMRVRDKLVQDLTGWADSVFATGEARASASQPAA